MNLIVLYFLFHFEEIKNSIKIEVPVYNWNFYLSDGGIITILVEEEEISWSYYYNNAEFKFVEYTNTYKKKEPK